MIGVRVTDRCWCWTVLVARSRLAWDRRRCWQQDHSVSKTPDSRRWVRRPPWIEIGAR